MALGFVLFAIGLLLMAYSEFNQGRSQGQQDVFDALEEKRVSLKTPPSSTSSDSDAFISAVIQEIERPGIIGNAETEPTLKERINYLFENGLLTIKSPVKEDKSNA